MQNIKNRIYAHNIPYKICVFLKLQKYSKLFSALFHLPRKFTESWKSDNDNVARDAKDRLILERENIRRRLSPFNIEIDFIKEEDREMHAKRSDNTREDCSSTPVNHSPPCLM